MGCVSSNLLSHDDEFAHLGSSALGHHIVKLTSTTYGLLTLDPPLPPPSSASPMTPPQRLAFGPAVAEPKSSLWSDPRLVRSEPEVINSWELMSGLDTDSFRFSPLQRTPSKLVAPSNKENSNPNHAGSKLEFAVKPIAWDADVNQLERFEKLCPPNGENKVVVYTTSLRGVRKTFEACNAVRSAIEGFGVGICERDVSMDRGFREELRELMGGKDKDDTVPPRVFVRGKYLGGAEEVLKMVEEGQFVDLIRGLPRKRPGGLCDGCGGIGFLPCFSCNGSCKVVQGWKSSSVVVRCPDCNENGLVLCPICS